MKVSHSDLWTIECDARVITTNLVVKKNGELVMGAGVAKQAADRYPILPAAFGGLHKTTQDCVYVAIPKEPYLISFPTKYHWKDPSSLKLIEQSAVSLKTLADVHSLKNVVLPPPGCGLGKLKWEDVEKVLNPILDDRFTVLLQKK